MDDPENNLKEEVITWKYASYPQLFFDKIENWFEFCI